MKFLALNGSPRGKASNTELLLEHFRKGLQERGDHDWNLSYLNKTDNRDEYLGKLKEADVMLLSFPLYTDSLPGIVSHFIEGLDTGKGYENMKAIFMVHSGFGEGIHTEWLEKWFEKLCLSTGMEYVGTIRKPGSEGLKIMPDKMTEKVFSKITGLGRSFDLYGVLNADLLEKLKRPRKYNVFFRLLMRILDIFGVTNYYWNMMLKKNHAYDRRFDMPYS